MKEYRIIEDVTGLFFIEKKTTKRIGFFRKKIEVWEASNRFGNINTKWLHCHFPEPYLTLEIAKKKLDRFKQGKIIHLRTKILLILLFPILTFSQTKQEVYNYLVEIGCKHPEIVTAQSILETGHFKSFSCTERNNLFGLRYNHIYLVFDTWQAYCDSYLSKVQYRYVGGDYYEFLDRIGYATDVEYCLKLKSIIGG